MLALEPGSKRPATGHGVLDATADPAQIEAWWSENPRRNIGIRPELVIDLDCKNGHDGAASFEEWLTERGLTLSQVPWAETPSGGSHLFLGLPPGYSVPSRAGVLPGVDIRGSNGYVAAWPSQIRLPQLQRPGEARETAPVYGTYTWHRCPCQRPVAPDRFLAELATLHGTGNGNGNGNGTGTGNGMPPLPPTEQLLASGVDHPHDVNMSRLAARLCSEGMSYEQAYQTWRRVAGLTPQNQGWPFTEADFRRHWKGPDKKGFGEDARLGQAWAGNLPAAEEDTPEPDDFEPDNAADDAGDGQRPPRPGLDSLVNAILATFEFARDSGGELFLLPSARLRSEQYIPRSFLTRDVINLGHLMWRRMAQAWNTWVRSLSKAERRKQGVTTVSLTPSDTTIRNAVSHLEALGMAGGRTVTAALRAARVQGGTAVVIDLGDETGRIAYVSAAGWRITDPRDLPCPPPVFRRSLGYLPLPAPVPGGNLDELWGILRITSERTRALAAGWLVAAYFADQSRPGLWLTGPPGSGKTTAGAGFGRIIDGLDWLGGKMDKSDERNNIIRAVKCFVPSFDNMTGVTGDQSDWICQLVTGHRDMFRRMRTNFDDVSMAYRRTFVATGLALPYGLAADALDRIIEAPVDPIPENLRVSDEQIRRELDEARPRLLGAILDHVAAVLGRLPGIPSDQGGLSRMNGYARILLAHDQAYGTSYLTAYLESVRDARQDKATDEPVVQALLSWLAPGYQWTGALGELLEMLDDHHPQGAWWPANPRSLSVNLTKNHAVIEGAGITVQRTPDRRLVIWRAPGSAANAANAAAPY